MSRRPRPAVHINTNRVEPAYPIRSVRIVEPFGAGGGPDLLARALADQLARLWGQSVVVENITGNGATAGPAQVAKSPADGYTLLINTNAQAYSAAASKSLPYDPLNDFVPVIPLTKQPYVLITGASSGVKTVGELIASAKAKPGQLTFGSTGIGTGTHIGGEKFKERARIETVHVPPLPTDSNANMMANVASGRVTYWIAPISLALPQIQDGKLTALGVTTANRSSLLPDVPTIAEAGVTGFEFPIWYGMWVRAGTPATVTDKLVKDVGHVIEGEQMRAWIAKHGGEPMNMKQLEFARFVLGESKIALQILNGAALPR